MGYDEGDIRYKDYHPIYLANRERLPDDYFSYVRDKRFNQLFRNELLALQLRDFDFIITGLFCHHDDEDALIAGREFQKKIGNRENDYLIITYADYFEHMQKLDLSWEQRGIDYDALGKILRIAIEFLDECLYRVIN